MIDQKSLFSLFKFFSIFFHSFFIFFDQCLYINPKPNFSDNFGCFLWFWWSIVDKTIFEQLIDCDLFEPSFFLDYQSCFSLLWSFKALFQKDKSQLHRFWCFCQQRMIKLHRSLTLFLFFLKKWKSLFFLGSSIFLLIQYHFLDTQTTHVFIIDSFIDSKG